MLRYDFIRRLICLCGSGTVLTTGCSKGTPDEETPDMAILLTIDLDAELKAINDTVYNFPKGLFIKRIATGDIPASFICFSLYCTHAGCFITPQNNGEFHCPCHGSKFYADGTVLNGPAARPLNKYSLEVRGNSLLVKR